MSSSSASSRSSPATAVTSTSSSATRVLAVFGAPERIPQHADRAVQCAVEIARTINSRRPGDFEVGRGCQHRQRRRGRDRRRRAALLQRDRRRRQPLLPGGGRDPRDRRPGADHRRPPARCSPRRSRWSRGASARSAATTGRWSCSRRWSRSPSTTGPGEDVSDPLGDPVVGGLGRAPEPGDGLGRRARPGPGVGRAGTSQDRGLGSTHTLPGS